MADIVTPGTARKTEDFTTSQIELVRNSLAIADNPILPDRTYIMFDAIAGNNNLHIDVGPSSTYVINKGEGGLPASHTDTGGIKVLNYTNAGRYLITIDGNFNGIDLSSASQSDKDKYISVIGGSNYPDTIVINAFNTCSNLESVIFPNVIETETNAFTTCSKLKGFYLPLLVDLGQASFVSCVNLIYADLPLAVLAWSGEFQGCTKLKEINLPSTLLINNTFSSGCVALKIVNIPLVTNIGPSTFSGCTSLKKIELGPTVTISSSSSFLNVVLTDVFVNGTQAQANTIITDIVTAGGLFAVGARLMHESGILPNVVDYLGIDMIPVEPLDVNGNAQIYGDVILANTGNTATRPEIKLANDGFTTRAAILFSTSNEPNALFLGYTGIMKLANAPVYANNAAALAGGLVAGQVYKTAATGDAILMITNAT